MEKESRISVKYLRFKATKREPLRFKFRIVFRRKSTTFLCNNYVLGNPVLVIVAVQYLLHKDSDFKLRGIGKEINKLLTPTYLAYQKIVRESILFDLQQILTYTKYMDVDKEQPIDYLYEILINTEGINRSDKKYRLLQTLRNNKETLIEYILAE